MIGEEIRSRVFRDTTSFYEKSSLDLVSDELITFARRHSGKKILDLGCATGSYSLRLSSLGYEMVGVDINPRYVEIARTRGVDAHLSEGSLPFADGSFDSVIMFEVLEHLSDPASIIVEASRVARKNVLFTTPHSGGIDELKHNGLLYEHFGDLDHRNFFTEASLTELLKPHFANVTVTIGDPIDPLATAAFSSRVIRLLARLAQRTKLVRSRFFSHLFAVAEL